MCHSLLLFSKLPENTYNTEFNVLTQPTSCYIALWDNVYPFVMPGHQERKFDWWRLPSHISQN